MKIKYLTILAAFFMLAPWAGDAYAKPKKPAAGEIVTANDLFTVTVKVKMPGKKKAKNISVSCMDKTPGKAVQKPEGILFTSYKRQQQLGAWRLKYSKLSPKARKSVSAQIANAKLMQSKARNKCKSPGFLGLSKYKGPWGEKQVRRLLEVFAFGGKESLVQSYVQAGMNATIEDLFNINKPDSYLATFEHRLSCDDDPDDGIDECYPFLAGSDKNDYYLDGYVAYVNMRAIYSQNPVRDVLFKWVMDNRAAVHRRPIGGNNRWMIRDFVQMVDRFTASGDYKQFVRDYTLSDLGHGKCLSGENNQSVAPQFLHQEDFGRELVELILFSPGHYTDIDIIQISRALTGNSEDCVTTGSGQSQQTMCDVSYHNEFHYPNPVTIFAGTPYEINFPAIVQGRSDLYPGPDLANALMDAKPDVLAYDLARELWPQFINDLATPSALKRLADLIKKHDFNLWPVLKAMASSQAFYDSRSEETIIKDPYTYLISFLRMSGIPVTNYLWVSGWFDSLGMRLLDAPTVFGWSYDLPRFTADVYQLPRVNTMLYAALWQDLEDLEEQYQWTPHNGLIATAPQVTGDAVSDIVIGLVKRLNLADDVTQAEMDQYKQLVNYYLGNCNQGEPGCFQDLNGDWKELVWDPPNPIDTQDDFYRVRMVLMLLAGKFAFATM